MNRIAVLLKIVLITAVLSSFSVSAEENSIHARKSLKAPAYSDALVKSRNHIKQGRLDKALRTLKPFISDPARYPDAAADYIATLVWTGNYRKAIDLYEALPPSFPTYTYLIRNMAKAYYESGQNKKALILYKKVFGQFPEDAEAGKGILLSLNQSGNKKTLLYYLDIIKARNAGAVGLSLTRSKLFMKQERFWNAFYLIHDVERKGWLDEGALIRFYRDLEHELSAPLYTSILNWLYNQAWKGNVLALSDLCMMLSVKGDYQTIVQTVDTIDADMSLIQNHSARWIAWAYFKNGNNEQAKRFYLNLLEKNPTDMRAKTGLAYCYAAEGNISKSFDILDKLQAEHPGSTDILFARAYASERAGDFWSAFRTYDQILEIDKGNRVAEKQRLIALSELGVVSYASDVSEQSFPDDTDLRSRFKGDKAVELLRWKEHDQSLAMLSGQMKEETNLRARYDYIIALTSNLDMEEAVQLYEELEHVGIDPPLWVREHIAGAYLYLEKPYKALSLYKEVLAKDPDSYNSRLGTFYVLQELRQWNEARKILNELDEDVPLYLKPGRKPRPNWPKADIALAKGWFLAYEDRLKEADDYFQTLNSNAPANTNFRTGLAYTHLWRGWPGQSLREFDESILLDPEDVSARTGRIMSLNDTAHKKLAREEAKDLLRQYPKNKDVKDAVKRMDLEEMRALNSIFSFSADEDDVDDYRVENRLTQPLTLNTDIYVYGLWQKTTDGNQESVYRRAGAGVDHVFNSTLRVLQQCSVNYNDAGNFGSLTRLTVTPDDYWAASLAYNSFSTDVPLRARVFDIDADELNLSLTYRQSEWRKYRLSYTHMEFSDGNGRNQGTAGYEQGVYVGNDWKMRLYFDLFASNNSKDDAPYFNPEDDLSFAATYMTEHTVKKLYRQAFIHRLYLTAGGYSQAGQAVAAIGSVRYEHDVQFSYTNSLLYGAAVNSRSYDGRSVTGYSFDINWRLLF